MPVCTTVPAVKIADQRRIEPRRPKRSAVKACPRAPTNVLDDVGQQSDCSKAKQDIPSGKERGDD